MWQAKEVIGDTWHGAFVYLAGEDRTVHTGRWEPIMGCFGSVQTDCGGSGVGYLDGDGIATCVACLAQTTI